MINEAFADVLVEGDACGQTAIQAGLTSPLAVIIVPLPGSPPGIHRLNRIVVHGFLGDTAGFSPKPGEIFEKRS